MSPLWPTFAAEPEGTRDKGIPTPGAYQDVSIDNESAIKEMMKRLRETSQHGGHLRARPIDPQFDRRKGADVNSKRGRMKTDRPERYAKQLASHWAKRGPASEEHGATVMRWETGQVISLRPVEGALDVEVSVPEGGDLDRFAQVVAEHLQRFGNREELEVVWS